MEGQTFGLRSGGY